MEITDYYHAFLYLGALQVYDLVLSSGLEAVTRDVPEAQQAHAHARLVSVIAQEIARLCRRLRPEVAATIALLHDVAAAVTPLVRRTRPELVPLLQAADPSVLGAALLQRWGLPEGVVRAVAAQREPELAPPDQVDEAYRVEVAVLYVAHLCHDALVGTPTPVEATIYAEGYQTWLGLPERSCAGLVERHILPLVAREVHRLPMQVRRSLPPELRG